MDKRAIYHGWLNAGFLPEEAEELTYGSKGVEVGAERVYKSATARAARGSRQWWIRDLLKQGWTEEEIAAEIRAWCARDAKRSPWDFIRAEYEPPVKKDYREAARRRAEADGKILYRW